MRFLDVDEEQPWDKKSPKLRWFSILRPATEKKGRALLLCFWDSCSERARTPARLARMEKKGRALLLCFWDSCSERARTPARLVGMVAL